MIIIFSFRLFLIDVKGTTETTERQPTEGTEDFELNFIYSI